MFGGCFCFFVCGVETEGLVGISDALWRLYFGGFFCFVEIEVDVGIVVVEVDVKRLSEWLVGKRKDSIEAGIVVCVEATSFVLLCLSERENFGSDAAAVETKLLYAILRVFPLPK